MVPKIVQFGAQNIAPVKLQLWSRFMACMELQAG